MAHSLSGVVWLVVVRALTKALGKLYPLVFLFRLRLLIALLGRLEGLFLVGVGG